MSQDFVEQVTSDSWLSAAKGWIRHRLAEHGMEVGSIGQRRVRPWSTGLVASTDAGPMYFKASCPAMSFEPAVHAALAEIEPHEVDQPLAIDARRGWLLTRGRGQTLQERGGTTTADWTAVVRRTAAQQRRLASHGVRLRAAGLPDQSLPTVVARFDRLVDELHELPADHPCRLTDADRQTLAHGRPGLVAAVAELAEHGLLPSFQHGDLHPGNVLVVGDDLRVFDVGDAMWSHPLEVLVVPWGFTRLEGGPLWRPIVAAWAAGWGGETEAGDIERIWPSVLRVHGANRAQTWWGALATASGQPLRDWADAPRHYLLRAAGVDPR